MGRARAAVAWTAVAVVAGGLGFWAGRATFVPPSPQAESSAPALVSVEQGVIGSTIEAPVTVSWPRLPALTSPQGGMVTSIDLTPGEPVDQGDVLLTLDLHPVVVAQGSVPSFRELAPGDEGADVDQLQRMLADLGYLETEPDGVYGSSTQTAVRAWQKASGQPSTGTVAAGSVVFVPKLPTRMTPAAEVTVGRTVAGGADLLVPVQSVPEVTIRLDADRRTQTPTTGQAVRVDLDGTQVEGVVGESAVSAESGATTWQVLTADGDPLCAKQCPDLPFTDDQLTSTATIVTAPEVTGPVVPLAALATAADGSSFLVGRDGDRVPVTIEAQDGTRAVVTGIAAGTRVLLFAGSPEAQPDQPGGDPAGDPGDQPDTDATAAAG
ncbi:MULTISPECIES: peptidoglycan-binding protein [Cellulomonas]|uniref:Peptidoglycan-binding domain 1 protein n=1 Tax=Cellulomonas gilvus (strain ATCC 13127 / NRRL B-14078) TaxID=593907 RepID=F8A5U5_CELGA|nr:MULTISPECIES: peptidoglycan-binding protein [Cellulomonas]AEI13385.1 Peptidoglycan-binding domain 1 protein [Cellulomonas gilvus ATCC 13127]MCR6688875.1 peptidoglycan-binding protein [Cellulomonas sp.]